MDQKDKCGRMKAGRELDALVATEILGWKVLSHWDADGAIKHLIDENQCEIIPPEFKPYSTDISAAFEVVEKLLAFNPFWKEADCLYFELTPTKSKGWYCNFGDSTTGAYANTASHAISLAALKVTKPPHFCEGLVKSDQARIL